MPSFDPVHAQLLAYNQQDIEAFVACYHPAIAIENGRGERTGQGHAYMRERYTSLWERYPTNHAQVLQQTCLGPWVIDEELISGRGEPYRVLALYEVRDELIVRVRFLTADDPA